MTKPSGTKTTHILPFGELSPVQFERLCVWLVRSKGYLRPEHLGEAGNEQGRDVIAYRVTESGEQLWYLHPADYHLESARLRLTQGNKKRAREHLTTAKEMIERMGYHRRDKEVNGD